MANINELEWSTPTEENKYPVANTVIGGEEVVITKYDEDSFSILQNDNVFETNLSQLELMFINGETNLTFETPFEIERKNKVTEFFEKWKSSDIWNNVEGLGNSVIEVEHTQFPKNTKLRIIKENDLYKVAVVGIPPNDGEHITYEHLNWYGALINYAYAIGLDITYIEQRISETDINSTDYEIVND